MLVGEGLSGEIFEILVKVVFLDEEKREFQKFDGEEVCFGLVDCFIYVVLSVLNVWLRFEVMLYRVQYKEDFLSLREFFEIFKVGLYFVIFCFFEQSLFF